MSVITMIPAQTQETSTTAQQNAPKTKLKSSPLQLHKLGLIAGLGPQASIAYASKINRRVNRRLGGWTSAPMITNYVEFSKVKTAMDVENWGELLQTVSVAADEVFLGNAKALVLCSNTLHCAAKTLSKRHRTLPIIHIGNVTARAIKASQLQRIGLLGTRITMTEPGIILDRLRHSGATIYHPNDADMVALDDQIFHNLYKSENLAAVRATVDIVIKHLVDEAEIQGVVLGSTELEACYTGTHQKELRRKLMMPDFQFFKPMDLHIDAAVEFICTGTLSQSI